MISFPYSQERSTLHFDRLHDFLSLFLVVIRMSLSAVSLCTQLNSGYSVPAECFSMIYDLNGFKFIFKDTFYFRLFLDSTFCFILIFFFFSFL